MDYSSNLTTLADYWDGTSWSLQATANPQGATNSSFGAVSCTAAAECEAVGSSDASQALAERWNGSTWSIQPVPLPNGAAATSLEGLSCESSTACIAVGGACLPPARCNVIGGPPTSPYAEAWNGTAWSPLTPTIPSGATSSYLESISCPSASTCSAAGFYEDGTGGQFPLVERWSGGWTVQSTPVPRSARESSLAGVSCPALASCLTVGVSDQRVLAEGWNGTGWSLARAADPSGTLGASLNAVACASSTSCLAVGNFSRYLGNMEALGEHWDGTAWSIAAPANPKGSTDFRLSAVSCSSATACTAVGGYRDSSLSFHALAERWDGTGWSAQSTVDASGAELNADSCATSTACIAVGGFNSGTSSCAGPNSALSERWDGTSWSMLQTPTPSGAACASLGSVSCISAAQCMAVGSYSDSSGHTYTMAASWNGTNWSLQSTQNPGAQTSMLDAISCPASTLCVAVGYVDTYGSMAEIWNGASWTAESVSGDCCPLTSVACPSTTSCIAVGELSNAEVWDGSTWSSSSPAQGGLVSISCMPAFNCTAVGSDAHLSLVQPPSGGVPVAGGPGGPGGPDVTLAETYSG
jgi:hypothetical protein